MCGIAGVVEYGVAEPKQHGIVMPPMGGVRLDQDQIQALSAYVYSLSHTAKPAQAQNCLLYDDAESNTIGRNRAGQQRVRQSRLTMG